MKTSGFSWRRRRHLSAFPNKIHSRSQGHCQPSNLVNTNNRMNAEFLNQMISYGKHSLHRKKHKRRIFLTRLPHEPGDVTYSYIIANELICKREKEKQKTSFCVFFFFPQTGVSVSPFLPCPSPPGEVTDRDL